eukprot:scaffold9965_cov26-Tisochrysis_lutea.AAC.1
MRACHIDASPLVTARSLERKSTLNAHARRRVSGAKNTSRKDTATRTPSTETVTRPVDEGICGPKSASAGRCCALLNAPPTAAAGPASLAPPARPAAPAAAAATA